jgi:hypothetical protein
VPWADVFFPYFWKDEGDPVAPVSQGAPLEEPWQIARQTGGLADETATQGGGGLDQAHANVARGT